jgi:hypothetical protein
MSKKYTDSTKEIFKFMDKGVDVKDAYSLVKPDKQPSIHALKKMKSEYNKWSLCKPDMVESAHNAVKETIEMKKVKGQLPSINNRLQAASMVLDRAEPKVTVNHSTNVDISYDPVDLAKYLISQDKSEDIELIED